MKAIRDIWANICPQLRFIDGEHTPDNKLAHQWEGKGELSFRSFGVRSLAVTITEIGGPPGGRQVTRSISMDIDPVTLRDFLIERHPL